MGFIRSKKGSIISEYFKILKDVGGLRKNNAVNVALYDKYLTMSNFSVKQPLTLQYSQITCLYYGESYITHYKKRVLGTFAGGVLFGGIGALVGMMSANNRMVKRLVFAIKYTNSMGKSVVLEFEDTRKFKGEKLFRKLWELCDTEQTNVITSLK